MRLLIFDSNPLKAVKFVSALFIVGNLKKAFTVLVRFNGGPMCARVQIDSIKHHLRESLSRNPKKLTIRRLVNCENWI